MQLAFNIKGNSLVVVRDAFVVSGNVFLVGPTQADKPNIVDGVVKFKLGSLSYEEIAYSEIEPTLAFVRQDFFNAEYADLFFIGAKKTYFYNVKKNVILINTNSFTEEKYRSVQFTVKCTAANKSPSESTFTIETQLNINDNPQFLVPNVTAYAGSKWINVPSNFNDIRGNSPELTGIESSVDGLDLDYLHISPKTVTYTGDKLTGISHLRHIGENIFAAWSDEKVIFFRCARGQEEDTFACDDILESIDVNLTGRRFLKAQVLNSILIVLTTTADDKISETNPPATTMIGHSAVDGQEAFSPVELKFYAKLAEIRMWDNKVTIIAVGGATNTSPLGLYGARFDMFGKSLLKELHLIQRLNEHICPTELSWAPRQRSLLYLGSVCGEDGRDSHVYEIGIDYQNPVRSEIQQTYQVQGSKDFRICAQSRLMNIIDFNNEPKIYSFDTQTSYLSKVNLPLSEYGITRLIRHTCDQDNNVLQVIGCTDKPNDCKLITYRADLLNAPWSRVHSVVDIVGQDSEGYTHLASSYNDVNDDTFTILIGDDISKMALYELEIDGPHIRLGG